MIDIMKAKFLKAGGIYSKNGYTVSYSAGSYYFSALYNSQRASTLKEIKDIIKNL